MTDLGQQLEATKLLYGTEVQGGHVWHLSLSNPVGDRELSDEEWAAVAKETMDRLGFSEASGKAPCPWVAVRHGRSASGNDHVHIAVSLVREDGTKASIWRDRVRLSELCAELEHRLGLTVVDGRQRGGLPAPGRPEMESVKACPAQLFEEAQHVQFYLTLLHAYVTDPEERGEAFAAVEHVPSIKAKTDFCFQWMGSINELNELHTTSDRRRLLLKLICFAACIEGHFFLLPSLVPTGCTGTRAATWTSPLQSSTLFGVSSLTSSMTT